MVGAHQSLHGLRDLTTPLSENICDPWVRNCYSQPAYQILLQCILSPPTMKIRKRIQNVENGMVWGSYGSTKVIKNSAFR